MKRTLPALCFASSLAAIAGACVLLPAEPAAASLPVFDFSNYSQNLLVAARALNQINNQIKSLQNEASMIRSMEQNLQTLDFPQLAKITAAMNQINQLMGQAKGIEFKVQGLDEQVKGLFPGALQKALSSDQRVAEARSELDAATSAYRQAMNVQSQVAENVQADAGTLTELAQRSSTSVGSLQAEQAVSQLIALSIKQQFQLQNLMASEFREAAIDRARRAQAEEDGRAMTSRFLNGTASGRN